MKTIDEALATLDENREAFREINKVDDPIEQGYLGAPYLLKASGATRRQVVLSILLHGEADETNALRSLGVIKWCLERME